MLKKSFLWVLILLEVIISINNCCSDDIIVLKHFKTYQIKHSWNKKWHIFWKVSLKNQIAGFKIDCKRLLRKVIQKLSTI